MTYSKEFKETCFKVFKFRDDLPRLLGALEKGNHLVVRYCLEDALDDSDLYVKDQVTDDGDLVVANSKIHAWKDRQALYSEFMDKYIKHLDRFENVEELVPA